MGETGPKRRRVFIEDARANGMYLRTTWHPEAGQFVISTWDEELCTGAVRIPAGQSPALIGLLVDGLADAATAPPVAAVTEPAELPPSSGIDRLRFRLRAAKAALLACVRRRPAVVPDRDVVVPFRERRSA